MQTLGAQGLSYLYISNPERILLEAICDGQDLGKHLKRFLDPLKYQMPLGGE